METGSTIVTLLMVTISYKQMREFITNISMPQIALMHTILMNNKEMYVIVDWLI